MDLKISNFNYNLPKECIALHPLADRDKCKLLVADGNGNMRQHIFSDIVDLLPDDAMLVYNNTRVINARMLFHKSSGTAIEIFCLEPHEPSDYALNFASTGRCQWVCFVGNSKRWKEGTLAMDLVIDGTPMQVEARRIERLGKASVIEFSWLGNYTFSDIIEHAGVIPIPPYLDRDTEDSDSTDYQTVYSRIKGSVAAPTAGLHFTNEVLQAISDKGIPRRELTLHVGAGTFQPVQDDDVSMHMMHSEFISVPVELIEELAVATRPESPSARKVYAVGTTSVRTLESLYHIGCLMSTGKWTGEVPQWYPYEADHPNLPTNEALNVVARTLRSQGLDRLVASTRIIIAPPYRYRLVKGMVTNFHQPKSTLLLLVSAFIGDCWREVYDYALAHDFRFLSYGDACLFNSQSM